MLPTWTMRLEQRRRVDVATHAMTHTRSFLLSLAFGAILLDSNPQRSSGAKNICTASVRFEP